MKRVEFYLTEEEFAQLEHIKEKKGFSRQLLLRHFCLTMFKICGLFP
jgi:hypothetical protein